MRLLRSLPLLPALLLAPYSVVAENPLQVSEQSFFFQIFDPAEPVNHTFNFFNSGPETIQVARIAITKPLRVVKALSKLPPGQAGQLIVSLGTPRQLGEYEGAIEISFKNNALAPLHLPFTGKITPVIEVRPLPAFFVATTRGKTNGASLEILNQDTEPLQIKEIRSPSSRYELNLAAVEPGRRYRLNLLMRPDAKPGRQTEDITLLTSSKKQPSVVIQANTFVHERVYAFPETIDLGAINESELKSNPSLTNLINQTLMIYQEDGTNFHVTAKSDLPFLITRTEASATGKQVQVEVALNAEQLPAGDFNGHLELITNDREFPRMEIKVKGQIR